MERMNWGSTFAVHQTFEAQAGDKIRLEWSGGTLGFMTIMAKTDFDAGRYGGPYPMASDISWAVWQVLRSGATVVFAVAEPPNETIQIAATLEKVPLPELPGTLSYGDLDESQGMALVSQAFALTNERTARQSFLTGADAGRRARRSGCCPGAYLGRPALHGGAGAFDEHGGAGFF